ncbi:hypothetical protein MXB_5308, partial [Myxobolus squamalis]
MLQPKIQTPLESALFFGVQLLPSLKEKLRELVRSFIIGVEPKKRSNWDLRGRLSDLESAFKAKTDELNKQISELETESNHLKDEAEVNLNKITDLLSSNESLLVENKSLSESLCALTDECSRMKIDADISVEKIRNLEGINNNATKENQNLLDSLFVARNQLSKLENDLKINTIDLEKTKGVLEIVQFDRNEKELEIRKLSVDYTVKAELFCKINEEYEELKKSFAATLHDLDDTKRTLSNLTAKFEILTKTHNEKCEYLSNLSKEYDDLKKEQAAMHFDITSTLNSQLRELQSFCANLTSDLGMSGNEVASLRRDLTFCRKELANSDIERRLMHHRVMELRGTIRVCCRIRPFVNSEKNTLSCSVEFKHTDSSMSISSSNSRETVTGEKADALKYDFSFDRIFGHKSSQADVFEEIEPLVQSALDGYSVCIFAYGQTGSGKTYTMEGIPGQINNTGLIQRAVDKIFSSVPLMKSKGWQYKIEASFLELYNENIRDLLDNDFSKSLSNKLVIKTVKNAKSEKELKKNGNISVPDVYVPSLTILEVTEAFEVRNLLAIANHNRTVAATKCNEFSSRSHSVFRLRLIGKNDVLGETSEADINLVDLAGSERLDQSGAQGDRMKETQFINKTLSALRNVIKSLCKKESHVPFRDSKLTHLLQASLGGNCKTLMFVNISPLEDSFQESLCSLRFATT